MHSTLVRLYQYLYLQLNDCSCFKATIKNKIKQIHTHTHKKKQQQKGQTNKNTPQTKPMKTPIFGQFFIGRGKKRKKKARNAVFQKMI